MLKITKGLKPTIGNDGRKGITLYIDSKGDDYVRVKTDDEDFYIAAHDYAKGDKKKFTWNVAMKSLKADGLTTLTKKQAKICIEHLAEVNDVLKEIDGDAFEYDGYWTSAEYVDDTKCAWVYNVNQSLIFAAHKLNVYSMRPTLNL